MNEHRELAYILLAALVVPEQTNGRPVKDIEHG